jgi:hypothetical protein
MEKGAIKYTSMGIYFMRYVRALCDFPPLVFEKTRSELSSGQLGKIPL